MTKLISNYKSRITKFLPDETHSISCESSSESRQIELMAHFFTPVSRKSKYLEFLELASQWKEETKFYSSLTDICIHPAYQRIIGMGEDALPFILAELESETNHWFWALTAMTGVDPVPYEHRGTMDKMKNAWLKWAQENLFNS